MMKKLVMAFAAGAATVSGLFAETHNVTTSEELLEAVGSAASGDEIVIAKSATPYSLTTTLALPNGVSVRGETDDFNDVIISGEGKAGCFQLGAGSAVSNVTFRQFYGGSVISDVGWDAGACYIENCRFTALTNNDVWSGTVISLTSHGGRISRSVIDNCRIGNRSCLVRLRYSTAVADRVVITNNSFDVGVTDGSGSIISLSEGAPLRNSFIGYNHVGIVRDLPLIKGGVCAPVVSVGGTLENCVVVGNDFVGCVPNRLSAVTVGSDWFSVRNCIILDNGMGADNWTLTKGSCYSYCLSTDTETMTSSFDGDWGDVVAKPGELPWIPHGSRAIGTGENGADIGRIWTPETLKCAIKQDRRSYVGAATANLLALASEEATFAWTLVSGNATLTPNGREATLRFGGLGTAVVRVTATAVSGGATATDEIALVSTLPVYEVANAAELEAAVDAAEDGAEIVIAAGDYVPTKTLVLAKPVTVRGATGNRADVSVSGNSSHLVFAVDHPGAVISSLSVRDAQFGIRMELGGLVTNVAVSSCSGSSWYGGYNSIEWHMFAGCGIANCNGTVVDCDISSNRKTSNLVGVLAYGQHGESALADRIFVTNNVATSGAGDYNFYSTPVALTGGGTIRNAFVAYNDVGQPSYGTRAQDSCGVYVQSGRLENSTVFRNRVHVNFLGYAAGVYLEAAGTAVNCLVTENGDANGNLDNCRLVSGATVHHCATVPVPDGATDCVDYSGEPALLYKLDAAGYPEPRTGAPTIDAGDDSLEWIWCAVDLFGKPRRLNDVVDIGAFEYEPVETPISVELIVRDVTGGAPFTTTLDCTVEGSRLTGLSYAWSYECTLGGVKTHGEKVTAEPTCTFADLPIGSYTFSLTVTNDREPPDSATVTSAEGVLTVTPGTCYASPTGGNVWPYDTEANAATALADAIAVAHDKVVVLPGDYASQSHVTDADGVDFAVIVDKPVWIAGTPRTVFDCAGLGGFKLTAAGAKISDLTITNFATVAKAGLLHVTGGVVSNVVVDGCGARCRLGEKLMVFTGTEVSDSTIRNINVVDDWNCQVPVSFTGKCAVRRLKIADVNIRYGGLLKANQADLMRPQFVSCEILNNKSYSSGLSLNKVDLTDCLIAGNSTHESNYFIYDASGSVFTRCVLTGNPVTRSGVLSTAAWERASPTMLVGCLVSGNSASDSGAILSCSAAAGGLTLVNTTVANNSGRGISADASSGYDAYLTMRNSIVYGNLRSGEPSDVTGASQQKKIDHSCYPTAEPDDENGNTAENPQFKGRGKTPYALKASSPCLGAGDASVWTADDIDLVGNPRLTKGVAVDMGCYENIVKGLMLMVK